MTAGVAAIPVTILAIISAWSDWRSRTIPNFVTVGGIGLGFLLALYRGYQVEAGLGFLSSCLLLIPFAKGWIGGGDAKLMMAYGTFLGPWALMNIWSGAAIISMVFALTIRIRKGIPIRKIGIPYAIPLAGAALWWVVRGLIL